jgi:hypothetical protein
LRENYQFKTKKVERDPVVFSPNVLRNGNGNSKHLIYRDAGLAWLDSWHSNC